MYMLACPGRAFDIAADILWFRLVETVQRKVKDHR